MSVTKRIVSGSAASWVKIGVTLLVQVFLVPVYLSYWSADLYGVWIAIQALVSTLALIDTSHQNYLGFEFLKLGKTKPDQISKYLWSGSVYGFLLGLLQIFIIGVLIATTKLLDLLPEELSSITSYEDVSLAILALSITWMFTGSLGGLLVRSLSPFGYYARMSWWGVLNALIIALSPIAAVLLDYQILGAALFYAGGVLSFNLLMYFDVFRLLKRVQVRFNKPDLVLGFTNLKFSLIITAKSFLDSARQQGARLIIGPLAGAEALTAFATMRTGANVALQGLGTLTNPLLPELMDFLNQRDQQRSEAAFATVWTVLVFLLAPGIVVLQLIMPSLFDIWTRGKVVFDPLVFGLLSLTILIFALAQPAIALIRGNNILKIQLSISIITGITVLGGLFLLVPILGLAGAGFALVAGELVDTYIYRNKAKAWLRQQGLKWPQRTSSTAAVSVVIAALAIAGIVFLPGLDWYVAGGSLILFVLNGIYFYRSLPKLVEQKIQAMWNTFKKPN